MEGFAVAVDRDVRRVGSGLDGVEDLATDPVHTDHRSPVLGCGVVGVGGAGDGQPVVGALCPHQAPGPRPAGDGEGLGHQGGGWSVGLAGHCWLLVVVTGGVLDPAEVPLHPHADAVVRVGQLEPGRVVVVEGEDPARDSSEVLETPVSS